MKFVKLTTKTPRGKLSVAVNPVHIISVWSNGKKGCRLYTTPDGDTYKDGAGIEVQESAEEVERRFDIATGGDGD